MRVREEDGGAVANGTKNSVRHFWNNGERVFDGLSFFLLGFKIDEDFGSSNC